MQAPGQEEDDLSVKLPLKRRRPEVRRIVTSHRKTQAPQNKNPPNELRENGLGKAQETYTTRSRPRHPGGHKHPSSPRDSKKTHPRRPKDARPQRISSTADTAITSRRPRRKRPMQLPTTHSRRTTPDSKTQRGWREMSRPALVHARPRMLDCTG